MLKQSSLTVMKITEIAEYFAEFQLNRMVNMPACHAGKGAIFEFLLVVYRPFLHLDLVED